MRIQNEAIPGSELSKVRTFLFWCLALVWFSEMLFLGVPFFNRIWIDLWQVAPPRDSQLVAASMITGAVGAPVKGAFFVMAVWGLRSDNPSTRTALFVAMSLVPPLNVAMPFRYQGFVPGPVMVGTTLSIILWVSFFLFRESYRQPEVKAGRSQWNLSAREVFQYLLFVITSIVISGLAVLFLFFPRTALASSFPCMPNLSGSSREDLSGMIYHSMASGTHLLALSVGSWLATANCLRNPSLCRAMAIALTVFTALFFIFPIRHLIAASGINCVTPIVLYVFAFLLIGWLINAFSGKARFKTAAFHTH